MKINELRPCDACSGPITQGSYVIRFSLAMLDPTVVSQHLGLASFFGGGNMGHALADAMGPGGDALIVAGDEDPKLMNELLICQGCMHEKLRLILEIADKRDFQIEREKDAKGS